MIGIIFSVVAVIELLVILALYLAKVKPLLLVSLPLLIQFPIFGGIGFGFLFSHHRKKEKRERLVANGYYETAVVVGIEQNFYISVNHQHPYHVVCHINRNGELHEYRSEGLSRHPGIAPGDMVPVYIDRQDEKNYYVDVESIMPEIIRH